ncbi:hypothetical protein [Lentilitoribacter sp. EG35]|uniref:hypothetical protein n=1 Tax=Lentilitoribacter sp. EG35 TaxID=3234192 RepID=UPI00346024E8
MIEKETSRNHLNWGWPRTGGSPTHEGLDSEIFDTDRFPHSATFVREAIQNVLDAGKDPNAPVVIKFSFYEGKLGANAILFGNLKNKKVTCKLPWSEQWDEGKFRWLVVEDTNTTGLKGNITKRGEDFWGYWLNFGRSNKDGAGRGGRGIGRITFLLASEIQTVLGITRRQNENEVLCCGMSVLKSGDFEGKWRSPFAIFAQCEDQDVFKLHCSEQVDLLTSSLKTNDYSMDGASGLSLIIPYPREELTSDKIRAAAIENFAPAIADRKLIVEINGEQINADNMKENALMVREKFSEQAIVEDPDGILEILSASDATPDFTLQIDGSANSSSVLASPENREEIREFFENNGTAELLISVGLQKKTAKFEGKLRVALRSTPPGNKSVDMFYRGGMLLPDVKTSNRANIDVFIFTTEDKLSSYLNFCEGKAHLGLLGNQEVRQKLNERGFESNLHLKSFVANLPKTIRALVQPDALKPDSSVFSKWFWMPSAPKEGKKKKRTKIVIPPIPKPKVKYFVVSMSDDGFEVKANPEAEGWPINLNLRFAYADGRAKPRWSPHDFKVPDLVMSANGYVKKRIIQKSEGAKGPEAGFNFLECDETFAMKVTGFDTRRELIVHHTPYRSRNVQNA